VKEVPARVHLAGAVEQQEPRLRDPDTGLERRGRERAHGAGTRDGIGIEEDDDVGRKLRDAEVAAAPEADVAARIDDADTVELERPTVVDDDDVVRLAGERLETPLQGLAAVVRDDDDADGAAQ
jgi:hypothetical protein